MDDFNDDTKDEQADTVSFQLAISTDNGRFLRRTCPSCGRDFKTEINPADIQWIVAPHMEQMGVDLGGAPDKRSLAEDLLYCPYCDHPSKASDTLTEDTIRYAKLLLTREVVLPMMHRAFSGLNNMGSGLRNSFISISFSYDRGMLPPRPIHGPEPSDMKIITFLCCQKSIKVSDNWWQVSACTYCNEPVVLI